MSQMWYTRIHLWLLNDGYFQMLRQIIRQISVFLFCQLIFWYHRAHKLSWFCPHSLLLSSSKDSRNNVCVKTQCLFLANLSGHPVLLFFFFRSFFPVWSVAMLHKWDLILLPWLQSFPVALKSKQQGCWHALYRKTQGCFRQTSNIWHHVSLFLWFWWVWGFMILQSSYGRFLFLSCAEDTSVAKQLQGIQQFYLPSMLPHLPLWRPQKGKAAQTRWGNRP